MQCDNCGREDASVQLTQIEHNEMNILHLCEACAAERGVDTGSEPVSVPLTDFLAQIGSSLGESTVPEGDCPSCGLSAMELRQTGRLGCATCYSHFEKHLRGLLRRLHGAPQHVGKVILPPDPDEADRSAHLQSLKRSLQRAIGEEEFERAAALRDEIRVIETE
ncbi:MAG TPA: UvrB/UvrC motif-containing protein [Longimicrobiaceae bacterium]|nr:UvrB/UvrC motif-containing protein [Longimicrobiaceae bacterium]